MMDMERAVKVLSIEESLVEKGLITKSQLDIAVRVQKEYRERGTVMQLGEVLEKLLFIDRETVDRHFGKFESASRKSGSQPLLPFKVCKKFLVNPLFISDGVLSVESSRRLTSPEKTKIIESCSRKVSALNIVPVDRSSINRSISEYKDQDYSIELEIRKLKTEITGGSLQSFIQQMFNEAFAMRASDVHITLGDDFSSWVAYRVDGDLKHVHMLPQRVMSAVFARIKMESGMDSSEARRSQDGRMSIRTESIEIEVRVASQPTSDGEKITMRLLHLGNLKRINTLFSGQPEMVDYFTNLVNRRGKSSGMLIVSGATGSGKSTTLYALAQEIHRDSRNLITVEDPVEYKLAFGTQIQVNQLLDQLATDFEKSLLRSDPDVVLFGEMRDESFAKAALKISESGHLMLTTVHANDALHTVERLQSIVGQESRADMLSVLSSALTAIVNQVLEKKLCSCCVPANIEYKHQHHAVYEQLGFNASNDRQLMMPVGCEKCGDTGYFDRTVVYEALLLDQTEETRAILSEVLLSQGKPDLMKLKSSKGIKFISRADSVKRLVGSGIIDMKIGGNVLHIKG